MPRRVVVTLCSNLQHFAHGWAQSGHSPGPHDESPWSAC
jgi:hypothetical protein